MHEWLVLLLAQPGTGGRQLRDQHGGAHGDGHVNHGHATNHNNQSDGAVESLTAGDAERSQLIRSPIRSFAVDATAAAAMSTSERAALTLLLGREHSLFRRQPTIVDHISLGYPMSGAHELAWRALTDAGSFDTHSTLAPQR